MPAGYDLSSEEGFEELLQDFEKIIGWQFLRGLHINDSKGVHVCFHFLFSKYFSEKLLTLLDSLSPKFSMLQPGLV